MGCEESMGGTQMQCVRIQSDYKMYYNKNAYYPYGCTDIDAADAPTGLTVQQCEDRCTQDLQCGCVTYARETGQCWKRANCVPTGWTSDYNDGYNVYVKNTQAQYTLYYNKNAYYPYGCTDIDTADAPTG